MNPQFYWYLTRSAGFVTFGLLTFSTALGISISARLGHGLLEKPWVYELHKFSALLALGFLGIHIIVLLPDPWTNFSLPDLFLPVGAAYRPFATAVGVIAMYGALIGTFSFYVRRWIGGYKGWRLLHYSTFTTFFLALLHGTLGGTDSSLTSVQLMYAGAGVLIFTLTLVRILQEPQARAETPQRAAFFDDTRPLRGDPGKTSFGA